MSAQFSDIASGIAPEIEAMLMEVTAGRDALPVGTRIGDYSVEQLLGRNDIVVAYTGLNSATREEVVIEEYLPEAVARRGDDGAIQPRSSALAAAYESGRRAFIEEAQHLSQHIHPALLRVRGCWQAGGTAYRVLPLIDEPALAELRATFSTPPGEDWLRALLQPLAGALQALHAISLVHGNVRPGNIVIQADGSPLLLGFDSARWALADLATHPEPGYLAIEQTERYGALPAGPWTDLYALAAVAMFCLSGRAPAPAVQRIAPGPSQPFANALAELRRRDPAVTMSSALVAEIDHALMVAPGQRPRSVDEFVPALGDPLPPSTLIEAQPRAVEPEPEPELPPITLPDIAPPPPASMSPPPPPRAPAPKAAEQVEIRMPAEPRAAADDSWRAVRPGASPVRRTGERRGSATRGWWIAAALPLLGIGVLAWQWDKIRQVDQVLDAFRPSVVAQPSPAATHGGAPVVPEAAPQSEAAVAQAPATAPAMPPVATAPKPSPAPAAAPQPAQQPSPPSTAVQKAAAALAAAQTTVTSPVAPTPVAATSPAAPAAQPAAATQGPAPQAVQATPPAAAPAAAAQPGLAAAQPGVAVATAPQPGTATAPQPAAAAVVQAGPATTPQPPPATAAQPGPAAATQRAPVAPAAAPPTTTTTAGQAPPTGAQQVPPLAAQGLPESAVRQAVPASPVAEPLRSGERTQAARPQPPDVRTADARRRPAAAPEPDTPRAACSPRTNFSLYRCMQTQCERDRFYSHAQCIRLRQRDEVS